MRLIIAIGGFLATLCVAACAMRGSFEDDSLGFSLANEQAHNHLTGQFVARSLGATSNLWVQSIWRAGENEHEFSRSYVSGPSFQYSAALRTMEGRYYLAAIVGNGGSAQAVSQRQVQIEFLRETVTRDDLHLNERIDLVRVIDTETRNEVGRVIVVVSTDKGTPPP